MSSAGVETAVVFLHVREITGRWGPLTDLQEETRDLTEQMGCGCSALLPAAFTYLVPCDAAAVYTRDDFSRCIDIGAVQGAGVWRIAGLAKLCGLHRADHQSEPELATCVPVTTFVERPQETSPKANFRVQRWSLEPTGFYLAEHE